MELSDRPLLDLYLETERNLLLLRKSGLSGLDPRSIIMHDRILKLATACNDVMARDGTFSSNESLSDINTSSLKYATVSFVIADILMSWPVMEPVSRVERLLEAKKHLQNFIQRMRQLELMTSEDEALLKHCSNPPPAISPLQLMRSFY